jgi:carbohydrate-selective porin OprB
MIRGISRTSGSTRQPKNAWRQLQPVRRGRSDGLEIRRFENPQRNDTAGIDLGVGRVSSRAAEADRDGGLPAQGAEELIELAYQAQVVPWLILQPDMQFVINPGAGVQNPNDPTHNLRDEFVAGVRAIVTF